MTETQPAQTNGSAPRLPLIKLNQNLYNKIGPEEVNFLKSQTKIEDEDDLKRHVLSVQKKAWDIVNYKCIQSFAFLQLKISLFPSYQDLLHLGKERPGAIFIDYACCFGSDARKAIADGYPAEDVLTADLRKGKTQQFWALGHELFKSMPETFPVPFVQGDIFDPKHIAPSPPFYSPPTTPRPILSTLNSLTPLQGHVSAIHVSQFFHLFDKERQIKAAKALASLLSPLPGSMIFGTHSSKLDSGEIVHPGSAGGFSVYSFSPEDWRALWDGVVFEKGTVEVTAELRERSEAKWSGEDYETVTEETKRRPMVWCVKRI